MRRPASQHERARPPLREAPRRPPRRLTSRRTLAIRLLIAAVLVIVAVAVWLYALPYLTAARLRTALQQNDAAALSKEIDYVTLRSNLKIRLNEFLGQPHAPTIKGHVIEAVGSALSGQLVNRAVEAEVTPAGLSTLMLGKATVEKVGYRLSIPSATSEVKAAFTRAVCQYESSTLFVITLRLSEGRQSRLFLRRTGLDWRLIDIAFPPL